MSELLNIGYYDRYILGRAASELETSSEEIKGLEETAPKLSNMRFPFRAGHTEMQDSIFEAEKKIISVFLYMHLTMSVCVIAWIL